MSWIPGWDSAASADLWSNVFFWAGIIALLFLGISEVVSHRYTERKDELVSEQQAATERRHDEEMARLLLETAQANERAANLEKEAEQLRTIAAWRRLSSQQYDILKKELVGKSFDVWTSWVGKDPEATVFRNDIDKALTEAGLHTKYFSGWEVAIGLQITNVPGPDHDALAAAFSAANISYISVEPIKNWFPNELAIIVGTKPPPF
jgi:hypothetical protein